MKHYIRKQLPRSFMLILLCTTVFKGSAFATVKRSPLCTVEAAQEVEEHLPDVPNWKEFAAYYSSRKYCDRSALQYSFTLAITRLLLPKMGIYDFVYIAKTNQWLVPVVLGHLGQSTVPADEALMIRASAEKNCPPSGSRICSGIIKAISSATIESTP
jgi:hypothetical protein